MNQCTLVVQNRFRVGIFSGVACFDRIDDSVRIGLEFEAFANGQSRKFNNRAGSRMQMGMIDSDEQDNYQQMNSIIDRLAKIESNRVQATVEPVDTKDNLLVARSSVDPSQGQILLRIANKNNKYKKGDISKLQGKEVEFEISEQSIQWMQGKNTDEIAEAQQNDEVIKLMWKMKSESNEKPKWKEISIQNKELKT
ncbi:unnamed protein product [Mytilus coruscus]|uniref:Uncharacterized protein n=1 Tax=Mytilus coruscus TaxID=42192 RepID=A0A6J8D944_MYTCO|nr:unnamed protein product [Mytilus coruscus]